MKSGMYTLTVGTLLELPGVEVGDGKPPAGETARCTRRAFLLPLVCSGKGKLNCSCRDTAL